MTADLITHSPIAHKRRATRRGKVRTEVSVRCSCGRFQSPWRLSEVEAAAAYAAHVGSPA